MDCILVPGTFAAYRGRDESEWWFPGDSDSPPSPFVSDIILPTGLTPVVYKWDADIDGFSPLPWHWFRPQQNRNWQAWGDVFAERLTRTPYENRIVIAHSHAGNVMAYAAAQVKVRLLITVSSPVRLGDMLEYYKQARANCGQWIHVHSDGSDFMQLLGSLFDGSVDFKVVRRQPMAHENVFMPKRGHSRLLNDPTVFSFWMASGIIGHLTDCLTT